MLNACRVPLTISKCRLFSLRRIRLRRHTLSGVVDVSKRQILSHDDAISFLQRTPVTRLRCYHDTRPRDDTGDRRTKSITNRTRSDAGQKRVFSKWQRTCKELQQRLSAQNVSAEMKRFLNPPSVREALGLEEPNLCLQSGMQAGIWLSFVGYTLPATISRSVAL